MGKPSSQMAPAVRSKWLAARTIHGGYSGGKETPEHYVWRTMHARCSNKNAKSYDRYGGAGVSVCRRWKSYASFLSDMGNRPTSKHQLDRYPDPFGNYEPSNCRWATHSEQQKNRRDTKRWVSEDGEVGTASEWADKLGISRAVASWRMKNWGTFEQGRQWQLQKIV